MKNILCWQLAVLALSTGPALAQDAKWGTIKGRIVWGGDKALPQGVIRIPAESEAAAGCLQANKGKLPPDETWVINPTNKGIKNTFVWLAPVDMKPLPIHPNLKEVKIKQVEMDQPACHFIPHALGLRQGQTLLVKNSAPFAHSFKSDGSLKENSKSVIVPPGGEVKIDFVADPRPIGVGCAVHAWMKCWVRVYDHPYFAVTDENGAFEIKDAPAGKFRLMVWNENGYKGGAAGRDGDPVQVQPGPAVDLGAIVFPPPKD